METTIHAVNFDATEALNQFVNKKIERLAHRHPAATEVSVTLTLIKPATSMNKQAMVRVTVPHSEPVVAQKQADSFEEAVDLALEAVERPLLRQRDERH